MVEGGGAALLTLQLLEDLLPLLVAAELQETLQHPDGVVGKRHLEAGRGETPEFLRRLLCWSVSGGRGRGDRLTCFSFPRMRRCSSAISVFLVSASQSFLSTPETP